MERPYKAEERNGYWIAIDRRTGEPVSYPTTKMNAKGEAAFMNREYAKLMMEAR